MSSADAATVETVANTAAAANLPLGLEPAVWTEGESLHIEIRYTDHTLREQSARATWNLDHLGTLPPAALQARIRDAVKVLAHAALRQCLEADE